MEQGAPRERHLHTFRHQPRIVLGGAALDAQVVDDEPAAADVETQAADMNGPVDEGRAHGFGAPTYERTKVDGDQRDQQNGSDHSHHEPRRPEVRQRRDEISQDRVSHWWRGRVDHDYSTTASTAPASTDWPSATAIDITRPSFEARSSFSIFIASTTMSP